VCVCVLAYSYTPGTVFIADMSERVGVWLKCMSRALYTGMFTW
jgi:hypothetical protein